MQHPNTPVLPQPPLVMQFHVTGRCNLRCRHCYRTEGDVEHLSLEDVIATLEQLLALRRRYNALHGLDAPAHVNLTGGEPFMRRDMGDILRWLGEHRSEVRYAVLSNGSFIDDDTLALLKATGASFVQLSIDGTRRTHDALRAPGDYARVFRVARRLEKAGMPVYVSFTANRRNYRQLPAVAWRCRLAGVSHLWSDRLVPIGHGEELESLWIGPDDLPRYNRSLHRAQGCSLLRRMFPHTEVSAGRALQFLHCGSSAHACSAASSLITVDEMGRIMPCRRLPILCGDVRHTTLEEVYFGHATFLDLRRPEAPPECVGCTHAFLCHGGARCQSHARLGDPHHADPACPLARR